MFKISSFVLIAFATLVGCTNPQNARITPVAPLPDKSARLAESSFEAMGGSRWHKVVRIKFTFNVKEDGKELVKATHDWRVRSGLDTVTWNGKTVTVDLNNPDATEETKEAYARWTNDSYWLLAPLKMRDPGTKLEYVSRQDIAGAPVDVVRLSFATDLGLTPGDQYLIYIDPKTFRWRKWDYMPNAETAKTFTWEGYQRINGLLLSTMHRSGKLEISFTEIQIQTAADVVYQ